MLNLSIPDHVIPIRAKVLDFIEREIYPVENNSMKRPPKAGGV
ncbi:MAG: hypothetical protein CM1200mP9_12070 [Gammaproteobacteria bacterium]|nr:MAG: hypothetical protein CM1200mP9_12070 [Gammaproteobacteria bacterium]